MNEPEVYATVHKMTKIGSQTVLQMFGNNMRNITEQDTVLDIGCGIGDVTRDILLPFCGRAGHVVASDISTSFLEYGREHYSHDRLTFEYLDIQNDVENVKNKWGPFARVYSFYCLHWAIDHERCLNNIASLLAPNTGECLLAFLVKDNYRNINRLASEQKWADYMNDVNLFLPNIYDLATAVPKFESTMRRAGLEVLRCELLPMCFEFDSVQDYKVFIRSVIPYYVRVPESEREEFLNECFLQVIKGEPPNIHGGYPLTMTYTLLVAHGRMK